MSRSKWGVVSGLFVLALGAFAVMELLRPVEASPEPAPVASPVPAPLPSVASPPVSIAPELPGVSPQISRVLEWNGDAGFANDEELAELSPRVVAVLTEYGVPLRIPETKDEE